MRLASTKPILVIIQLFSLLGCADTSQKAKLPNASQQPEADESQILVARLMAKVPKSPYQGAGRERGGTAIVCRAKDWKGDVKKTDSLANPVVGEITFRYQEQLDDPEYDTGWKTEWVYNLMNKAIYHVVDGKWRLKEIYQEASDTPGEFFSVSERFPDKAARIARLLPDNF